MKISYLTKKGLFIMELSEIIYNFLHFQVAGADEQNSISLEYASAQNRLG